MNKNRKNSLKSLLTEHKKIFKLLLTLSILIVIIGFTSSIPKKKLDKALEDNTTLYNEKYILVENKENLITNLNKEEKTKAKLDNSNKVSNDNKFKVVSGSKWKGIYTATQGETELILEINEHNAVFKFGPNSKNPDVKKGSYYMGKNIIDSKTGFIDLVYTEWIEEAYGYEMLNLSGVAKGDHMTGIVTNSSNNKIGNFKLSKIN